MAVAWRYRPLLAVTCCLLLIAPAALGVPYILLRNKAAKCFKLDNIPPDTIIRIGYHAPDLVLPEEGADQHPEDADYHEVGKDARYEERMKQRKEAMRRAKFKDINLVVTHRVEEEERYSKYNERDEDGKPRQPITSRERMQLEQKTGDVYFRTKSMDGSVEICVQSYIATQQDPSRVALNITSSEDHHDLFSQTVRSMTQGELFAAAAAEKSSEVLKNETSRITDELNRLEKKINDVFKRVEGNSKREIEFQEQSLKLNRAVRYWPIFRIVVLLIGGYLQVSSVLGYMKRKHIY